MCADGATKIGPNTAVVIPVKFTNQGINVRFLVNSSGLISGFFLLPGEVAWQRPSYSKPETFTERAVTLGEGEWALSGTLTMPNGAGPFPAIVLVHGSGPNDRDETVGVKRLRASKWTMGGSGVARMSMSCFSIRSVETPMPNE